MDRLHALIAKHEGLRLSMYQDTVGKRTIGYGHNMDDVPITEAAAGQILADDIRTASDRCKTFAWYMGLDEARRAVTLNMVFNMGITGFKKFKKTIKAIERGEYEKASIEMLDSKWSKQVGKRAKELSTMMRTGEWA